MLIDVYALAPSRNRTAVARFLDLVAPQRQESAEDYELPLFAGQANHTFQDVEEVIDHLIAVPSQSFAIYWRSLSTASDAEHVMLFFTGDGHLIYGVSIASSSKPRADGAAIERWLLFFARETGAREGYALLETHPEYDSRAAFLEERDRVPGPKLIDGILNLKDLEARGYLGPIGLL